jgi:hypothetical protein
VASIDHAHLFLFEHDVAKCLKASSVSVLNLNHLLGLLLVILFILLIVRRHYPIQTVMHSKILKCIFILLGSAASAARASRKVQRTARITVGDDKNYKLLAASMGW